MNSIWLKIAGAAVAVVVVIVVLGRFQGDKPAPAPSTPAEKTKTFSEVAERDQQFATAPPPKESQPAEEQPAAPEPASAEPPAAPAAQPPVPAPAPPTAGGVILPSSITRTTPLYFKPLSEENEVAAEQLLPWAATSRSIGRLPMMSYGPTVRACRDILARWPESKYAFRAKEILEDISNSPRAAGFNITRQELDISRFLKPQPGTEKIDVDPVQR